jgi:hypothetical protein
LSSRDVEKARGVGDGAATDADALAAMLAEKLSASRREL